MTHPTVAAVAGQSGSVAFATATVAPLDLYFDAAGGSPSNDGTSRATAFKDIPDMLASASLPMFLRHLVTLHFKASGVEGVAAVYNFPIFPILALGAPLVFEADEAWDPTCFETVASLTAAAGTTGAVINTAGLTANALNGDWIEFTSGAASAGSPRQRKQIRDNGTGSISLVHAFSPACASGDTCKVKRSTGVRIHIDAGLLPNTSGTIMQCASARERDNATINRAAVLFVGIELVAGNGLGASDFIDAIMNGGNYLFYGCRKRWVGADGSFAGWALDFCDAQFGMGAPSISIIGQLPGALLTAFGINDARWLGWGMHQLSDDHGSPFVATAGSIGAAYLVVDDGIGPQLALGLGSRSRIVIAGRLRCVAGAGNLIATGGFGIITVGNPSAAKTMLVCTGGDDAISANDFGGILDVSNTDIASVDGHQIKMHGGALARVGSDVTGTPSGTGKSVVAINCSKVLLTGAPALGGAFSVGDGADKVAADFNADGKAKINSFDGSCIARTSATGINASV